MWRLTTLWQGLASGRAAARADEQQPGADTEPGADTAAAPASDEAGPQPPVQQQLARRVFVSHTGQDEGAKTFAASILKPALEAAGLAVFMDFSSLELGCEWPAALVDAAAHSSVVVVVLSAAYVRRFWCMLELDAALHGAPLAGSSSSSSARASRAAAPLIIPVFYDAPGAVIGQAGAIEQHWRAQLAHLPADRRPLVDPARWAANVAAMQEHTQNVRLRAGAGVAKDEQLQLARRVVAAAVAAVPQQAAVAAVGFEQQEAQLVAELAVQDEARLGLWLHGQGGLGKTTMAKHLFNRLAPAFAHSALLELDAEEGASKSQQRLASALKQLGARGFNEAAAASVLLTTLQEHVRDKAVLLVLDNVWDAPQQLDALLPLPLGPGSRLVVTSRFEGLPDSSAWQAIQGRMRVQQLATLALSPAKQLFRRHSGLTDPPPQLTDLEADIIAACGGLPLALKIIGGQLWQKADACVWQHVLDSLRTGLQLSSKSSEDQLRDVLALSFQGLAPAAQSMFLDSISVLHERDAKMALAVWEAWWGAGQAHLAWAELQRRSLVGVDADGDLAVHDVIRSLGQAMLRDPHGTFYGSRVWVAPDGRFVEFAEGPLQPLVGVSLRGLGYRERKELLRRAPGFLGRPLDQLRMTLGGDHCWMEPLLSAKRLLWFQASHFGGRAATCRLPSFDSRPVTGLVVLDWEMDEYALTAVHQATARMLSKLAADRDCRLRFLSIARLEQLRQLPTLCAQLTALQGLGLISCKQLKQLPASFEQLAALQRLDLSWCRQLKELPASFGQRAALQRLDLSGCRQLKELPASFGQLAALQRLDLSGCEQLKELPASFGQLAALQWLDLSRCTQLSELPASFGQLAALQQLVLSGCHQLKELPASFGQLAALQQLGLTWCTQLKELPASFGQLAALQELRISGCSSLSELPQQPAGMRVVGLPGSFGIARGCSGEPIRAEAPQGSWISVLRVDAHSFCPCFIQGVLQDGRELPALGEPRADCSGFKTVMPNGGCFTEVYGTAGGILYSFLGYGEHEYGFPWTFACKPGHVSSATRGLCAKMLAPSAASASCSGASRRRWQPQSQTRPAGSETGQLARQARQSGRACCRPSRCRRLAACRECQECPPCRRRRPSQSPRRPAPRPGCRRGPCRPPSGRACQPRRARRWCLALARV